MTQRGPGGLSSGLATAAAAILSNRRTAGLATAAAAILSNRRTAGLATAAAAVAIAATASGQTVNVQRPATFLVGHPLGARADRIDAARTGLARASLPTSHIRTEWRIPLGATIEHAPLVDARGCTYLVGVRGEVMAIARDGTERWRLSTSAAQPGPAALLADDTVVFVDAAGEAVAVREGTVRWRVPFGRAEAEHAAPLALDDGGVVVATAHELAVLDAEGRVRARTILPEPTSLPLVAARGRVVAVTSSGAVWSWVPGAQEPVRVASFGSPVDSSAALADDHTLLGVAADGMHLTAVDLVRGTATTRAVAAGGLWLGPPAMRGAEAHVVLLTPMSEVGVTVDPSGDEAARVSLLVRPPLAGIDGGAAPLNAGPHTPPLVDSTGTLAFATRDGAIGVATVGTVDLLGEACSATPATVRATAPEQVIEGEGRRRIEREPATIPPVVGLAPLEAGAFEAVCSSGALLAISGRPSRGEESGHGRRAAGVERGGETAPPPL